MILQAAKQLEIQRVGDLNEGKVAGISDESLPFVFELISKQLYSNPIGSVIREITSNCFDSHIEAGVDAPVTISRTHDRDEGYSIEFKDVGIGMSPERVDKIYMNYFSSTKRGDNTQIGGFGIGSKTPLAYADIFYITTIFNGKKYEYLFHKGDTKPTLESLQGYDFFEELQFIPGENSEDAKGNVVFGEGRMEPVTVQVPHGEDTEEHNGTTIRIIIEDDDMSKFISELQDQLLYFDNVYFKNWGISNEYDIYEGTHFKFRSDFRYSDYNYSLHICIGQVKYPIDYTKVKVPDHYRYLPIAVKFDVGELPITPNREQIRYNDTVVSAILAKINLAVEEVIEMFNKQNPEIADLATYYSLINDKPKITFSEEKKHFLYFHKDFKGIAKAFKFKGLSGLDIGKAPKNMFFMWECLGYITPSGIRVGGRVGGKTRGGRYVDRDVDTNFILNKKYFILEPDDKPSIYTDKYISELNKGVDTYIITRKSVHKRDYDAISKELGIKGVAKLDNNNVIKSSVKLGKTKTIIQYIKVIEDIVKERGKTYTQLKPSIEWVKDYQRSIKESSAAYLRRKNQKIFVRDMGNNGNSKELSLYDVSVRKGIMVYGLKEDKVMLERIFRLVQGSKPNIKKIGRERIDKGFMVIQVSKAVEVSLILAKNKKIIYWEDFLKTKFFKKISTARYMHFLLVEGENIPALALRKHLLPDFEEDRAKLKAFIARYYVVSAYGGNQGDYIGRNEDVWSTNYDALMLLELGKFRQKHLGNTFNVPLIQYLNSNVRDDPKALIELTEYLKSKKIRLKNEFYLKSFTQQLNQIEDVRTEEINSPEESGEDLSIQPE